jgi:hypothetical protein
MKQMTKNIFMYDTLFLSISRLFENKESAHRTKRKKDTVDRQTKSL